MKPLEKFLSYLNPEAYCNFARILDLMLENYQNRNGFLEKHPKKNCLSKKQHKKIGDFLIEIGIFTSYSKYAWKLDSYSTNIIFLEKRNKEIIAFVEDFISKKNI